MWETDEFMEVATDPDQWFAKSVSLALAGDAVLQIHGRHLVSFLERLVAMDDSLFWGPAASEITTMGAMQTASLLFGLSIEVALKGKLLSTGDVAFDVKDGIGRQMSGSGHDLVELAKRAGLEQDNEELRTCLEWLSAAVRWQVRYPVPAKSSDRSPSIPWIESFTAVFCHAIPLLRKIWPEQYLAIWMKHANYPDVNWPWTWIRRGLDAPGSDDLLEFMQGWMK